MKNALIVVDVQNDFCEGGSLEVPNANQIIPVVNEIRKIYKDKFDVVILTQDHHPVDHISFNDSPYLQDETIQLDELTQKWKGAFNRHCVIGSNGTQFHKLLELDNNEIILSKGENKYIESFSGFGNPNLIKILYKEEIKRIYLIGLAYDYCVGSTALDAAEYGFEVFVIKDACRSIAKDTTIEMEDIFKEKGVKVIFCADLKNFLY